MASLNRSFVAKDSEGNVKKLSLEEVLSDYATLEDIHDIVEGAAPVALDQASLSFSVPTDNPRPLEIPFSTSAVKLSTYVYGATEPLYETEFEIEDRTVSNAEDAYRFAVADENAPFGVVENKKAFLVLSLEGLSSFSNTQKWTLADCRQTGTVGGNPIVLDWQDVVLGEGGTFQFAYYDQTMPEGFGVFGTLRLSQRKDLVGSIHWYAMRLEFTLCGSQAWKALREEGILSLSTRTTAGEESVQTADLSALKYPQIASVSVARSNSPLVSAGGSRSESLSKECVSALEFKAHKGIAISLEQDDPLDAAVDRKILSIGLDFEGSIGDGFVQDANGRLSVPMFQQATENSDGSFGLVPAPPLASDSAVILSSAGWTSLSELGFSDLLVPFGGSTSSDNGTAGLVPAPTAEDAGKFLRADGEWAAAVETISASAECQWLPAKKSFTFGVGICGADGSWMSVPIRMECRIALNGSGEAEAELEGIDFDAVHGVSLCHPYSSSVPQTMEDRTCGWMADKTLWSADKTRAYIVHFEDGSAAKAWLELRTDAEAQETRKTVLCLQAYAPQAVQPWCVSVQMANNNFLMAEDALAGTPIAFSVEDEFKVCTLPTADTVLFDGISSEPDVPAPMEPLNEDDSKWIDVAADPVRLDHLKLTLSKTSEGLIAIGIPVQVDEWPQELAEVSISLDYGFGSEEIVLGCLSSWLNGRLEAIDAKADDAVFKASSILEHVEGVLDQFAVPFNGASGSEAGTSGLVPAPLSGDKDSYLKGDGTWGKEVVVTETEPQQDDSGTVFFYIQD